MSDILRSFEDQQFVASVFIDLKKAFDSVSHEIILKKLECLGIRGQLYNWFNSYLTNRYQFTEVNGETSSKGKICCGVPQGSLIGVLLFKIQINDMHQCLKFCNSILYADDTTIYVIGRNVKFLRAKLQSDMQSLSIWLSSNQLKLNVKKTKLLLFHKDGLSPLINIEIDSEVIECVDTFKFLGIFLDQTLSFDWHINQMYARLSKSGFVLRKLSQFIRPQELKVLYFAHIHSILTYGITVWGTLSKKSNLTALYKLQKRLVRIVERLGYTDHCMPAFRRLNLLTLFDQIELECLILMYRVNNELAPKVVVNMFGKLTHAYGTRSSNTINIRHRSSLMNRSFLNKAPMLWQESKNEYRSKQTVNSLKKVLRKHYVEKY